MTEEPNLSAESLAILSDWLTEGPIGLPQPEQDLMSFALKKLGRLQCFCFSGLPPRHERN